MYAGSADQSSDHTKRDIFENFKKYSLEMPELIRMDNHLLDRHIHLRHNNTPGNTGSSSSSAVNIDRNLDFMSGMFDVIVTDPPYGIRAGAKKSGKHGQYRRYRICTTIFCTLFSIFPSASSHTHLTYFNPPPPSALVPLSVGKRKQVTYTVSADRRQDHIPSTQHYAVEEVMLDLLHTAARTLVMYVRVSPSIFCFHFSLVLYCTASCMHCM